jgi:hypothetical protein
VPPRLAAAGAVIFIVLGAPRAVAAPPNDDCSAVEKIPAGPFTDVTTTTAATAEGADPSPPCGDGSAATSVWYRFTAPASGGSLTVDTFGSDYDTILSAWTGTCGQWTPWPQGCNDDDGAAQSRLTLQIPGGQTVTFMVSAYFGDGGSLAVHASFSSGSGDISGLNLGKLAGGDLALSWSPSCEASDTDYEIYQGTNGAFTLPTPATCTTGGATTATLTPPDSSAYYLIVPSNRSYEGSYGRDGAGAERQPPASACRVQSFAGCPPACAHRTCAAGVELEPACDRCAADVCAADPFCCHIGWDATCVTEVRSVCDSFACPDSRGACVHGLCETGPPLTAQCDDPPIDPGCVTAVCTADSFCCGTVWDAACVAEVATVCGASCN